VFLALLAASYDDYCGADDRLFPNRKKTRKKLKPNFPIVVLVMLAFSLLIALFFTPAFTKVMFAIH